MLEMGQLYEQRITDLQNQGAVPHLPFFDIFEVKENAVYKSVTAVKKCGGLLSE